MAGISSSIARSPLTSYSAVQLLVGVLTELRLQTRLFADEFGSDEDLEQLRLEIMNDTDVATDSIGAGS